MVTALGLVEPQHIHVDDAQSLQAALSYGVTSNFREVRM